MMPPFSPLPNSMMDGTLAPILPDAWLGIVGGGQLGRFFCFAAQTLGYRVAVFDPDPESPAAKVAQRHICAEYDDLEALQAFGQQCAAISTEFENVPAKTLEYLAHITRVAPTAQCVSLSQDRITEKRFLTGLGLSVAPYLEILSYEDLMRLSSDAIDAVLPGILKTARLGYDGHGQIRVHTVQQVYQAYADLGNVRCVLEKHLDMECEVSVLLVRAGNGAHAVYPLARNDHQNGILRQTQVPAPDINETLQAQARDIAFKVAHSMQYVGVLCIELFVQKDGTLYVNEMAPRPHNSGHYTLDACVTNQFEQQVRAMTGLPLGSTHLHSAAVMLNILGDSWWGALHSDAIPITPHWEDVLRIPGAHLHLYGKTHPKRARKMGHVTVTASTLELAHLAALQCAQVLRKDLGGEDGLYRNSSVCKSGL